MAVVLQSAIGQLQTKKHIRGTAQAELYSYDINKFIVPLLPIKKQQKIGACVRESLDLLRKAHLFLEMAKHTVETAIEESEKAAISWLAQQESIGGFDF